MVAVAAGLRDRPLDTFTIGFFGAGRAPFAEQMARRYRTAHHAEAAAVDYIAASREQAAIYGEPFGDHSSVPTLRVCELARRDATVAMSAMAATRCLPATAATVAQHRGGRPAALPDAARRRLLAPLAAAYPKLDRAPQWLRAKYTLTEISLDARRATTARSRGAPRRAPRVVLAGAGAALGRPRSGGAWRR